MNRTKSFIYTFKIMLILFYTFVPSSSRKILPSSNPKPEKYPLLNLLNLFSSCTIHFVGSLPGPDHDPHFLENPIITQFQSVSRFIIETGFVTVSSVSEYFPTATTSKNVFFMYLPALNHRNHTPFFNFGEGSSDYRTLMRFSKHISSCLVQIPMFKNVIGELFQYFYDLNKLPLQPCCPPDYILILESKEIQQKSKLLSPPFFNSPYNLLLPIVLTVDVDQSGENIFFVNGFEYCTGDKELFGLRKYRITRRIKLDFHNLVSLETLSKAWEQILSSQNQFPAYKTGPVGSTCDSLVKPTVIRNKSTSPPSYWLQFCLNSLLHPGNSSFAISTYREYGTLGDSGVEANKRPTFHQKPRVIQNSCEFHGFRYVILLDWNKAKESSNSFHGTSLLQPFSLRMWMLVLFTTLLVSFTLFLSRTGGALFFTMATLLEQGDDGSRKKSRKNFLVIILWFFVAYFIRTAYTSSMYVYLTAEEVPKVPTSFRKVVAEKNYPIVGERHEMSMLIPRASAETKHYNYLNQLEGGRIVDFTLLSDISGRIVWNNNYTKSQLRSFASNQKISIARMKFYNGTDSIFGRVRVSPKEMMSFGEFSYLYSDLPMGALRSTGFSEVYAVVAYSGRRLVWNNESPFLNVLMGYKGENDLNGKMANELFGRIVHSGLWSHWKKTYKFVSVAKNLKTISEVLQLKKSWDFVNLARLLVSDITNIKNGLEIRDNLDSGMVQVEVLSVVWVLHGGLCMVCILIFLLELMYVKYAKLNRSE
ncbi:unnamed protein product [Orchesella dallaii]|uniref:Ionotropic receptor n=1 Tax=Orchesella dallaii TaxID=48710 RepID=A0ABP1QTG2_9HEXA